MTRVTGREVPLITIGGGSILVAESTLSFAELGFFREEHCKAALRCFALVRGALGKLFDDRRPLGLPVSSVHCSLGFSL